MKKPLLRMLWWLSVAPLGKPVVPLVYWMLIGSSNWRLSPRSRSSSSDTSPAWASSPSQPVHALVQLGVREADPLVPGNDRVRVRKAGHRALEVGSDRLAEERRVHRAMRVGELHGPDPKASSWLWRIRPHRYTFVPVL